METVNRNQGGISTAALSGVPETLLITLAARLVAARQNPDLDFVDPAALTVGSALAFDPARFASDKGSMRGSIVRALWFDHIARQFVREHPTGLVVSIGSGLDTRANRIDPGDDVDWVDIDFPEVVALRNALVPPLRAVRTWPGDGTRVSAWAKQVGWDDRRPVLVLAEGVSMYLEPGCGRSWVRALATEARRRKCSLILALDLASPFMTRHGRRNPSVGKTGASFTWGVGNPAELMWIEPGLVLLETYDVARHAGYLSRIAAGLYRLVTGKPLYSCALFRVDA